MDYYGAILLFIIFTCIILLSRNWKPRGAAFAIWWTAWMRRGSVASKSRF